MPGFRKGLAPLDVIRMRFKEEIKNDVMQEILTPKSYKCDSRTRFSQPLAEPHLHLEDQENVKVNGSQPIVFSINVEVMPEIPTPEYEGLGGDTQS